MHKVSAVTCSTDLGSVAIDFTAKEPLLTFSNVVSIDFLKSVRYIRLRGGGSRIKHVPIHWIDECAVQDHDKADAQNSPSRVLGSGVVSELS